MVWKSGAWRQDQCLPLERRLCGGLLSGDILQAILQLGSGEKVYIIEGHIPIAVTEVVCYGKLTLYASPLFGISVGDSTLAFAYF